MKLRHTLLALCLLPAAQADLLLYEGFDYEADGFNPPSGLSGKNGGIGFTGPWEEPRPHFRNTRRPFGVHLEGLVYSRNGVPLKTSGRCAYSDVWIPERVEHDELTRPRVDLGISIPGEIRWYSLLIRIPTPADGTRPNGWWSYVRFSGIDHTFGKEDTSDDKWGMNYPILSGGPRITYGETALLVLKAEYHAGGQRNTLWINPTPARDASVLQPEEAPAMNAVPMNRSGRTNEINLSSSCLAYLDEIRAGTTYFDVAPAAFGEIPSDPEGGGISWSYLSEDAQRAFEVWVDFDAGGGSAPAPGFLRRRYLDRIGPLPETTRPGFAFGGWWSGPDGTGQPVTPESRITTGGGRLTLYAKWIPLP